MVSISVSGLKKRYSRKLVLDGVEFKVEEGQMLTLLGSSGCGKSTTLRSIAGLEMPDAGVIRFGDRVLFDDRVNVAARRRDVGMVFQSYALWPNMTVAQNVAFPLRARSTPSTAVHSQVSEILETVGLNELADRYPYQLSGGQQQRVALARALVYHPQVMLFDEPLSNLDAGLRAQLRLEIRRIQRDAGITALYVTHDTIEALSMSDRMCIMCEGRIVAEDTPDRLWSEPPSTYVARFLGCGPLIDGRALGMEGECAVVDIMGQTVRATSRDSTWREGDIGSLLLRDVIVGAADEPAPSSGLESLLSSCRVTSRVGDRREAEYEIGDLNVRIDSGVDIHQEIEPGARARLWFNPERVRFLRHD